jgi:hypothetical protein
MKLKSLPKQTLEHDILMRSIKILDIGFINVIYIFLALFMSKVVDSVLGEFDEEKEKEKPLWYRIVELCIGFWMFGVLIYIIRNVVERIPFPLNGYQGFDHLRVKELGSAGVFSLSFFMFNSFLKSKVIYNYKQI